MGLRNPVFSDKPCRARALAKVLGDLEGVHPQARQGLLADLFAAYKPGPTNAKARRSVNQNWRRWTSGMVVPEIAEARRILELAQHRGWLPRLATEDYDVQDLQTALGITPRLGEMRRAWHLRKPVMVWARTLGHLQTEHEAQARLRLLAASAGPLVGRLMSAVHYPPWLIEGGTPLRPRTGDRKKALALLRVTMTELVCQMIEKIDHGLHSSSSAQHPEQAGASEPVAAFWAAAIGQIGNDLRLLCREASHEVLAAKGIVQRATKHARERATAVSSSDKEFDDWEWN